MNYKVYLSTKVNTKTLKKGSGIMVLEPDDYTKTAIKKIKAKGYKVLGYISVGTIEKERSWYKKYKKYGLKKLEDWPDEVYADVREEDWRDFLVKRAKKIKNKGFDGWWCDNLDVYEYYKSTKMFAACQLVLKRIKKLGGYLMINGGSNFISDAVIFERDISMINGYTQEEVFSFIKSYKGKGRFGRQDKKESLHYKNILLIARRKGLDIFLLEYSRDEKVKKEIKSWCLYNRASYYISKGVNL